MTDLLGGARDLSGFKGLAACGGFSYGDVLGAGLGWAKSILFHARTREMFAAFFARPDTFTIGVCNGCQMMSGLKEIIPGANAWPRFVRNRSDQFEARLSLVEIARTPSIVLQGMEGSRIPIAVSHGEGRVEFPSDGAAAQLEASTAGRRPVRRPRRPRDRTLPRKPERLVPRHHRRHDHRRPRDDLHAAPRAGLPHAAAVVAPARVAGKQPLDAPLPERPRLGRLKANSPGESCKRRRRLRAGCSGAALGAAWQLPVHPCQESPCELPPAPSRFA